MYGGYISVYISNNLFTRNSYFNQRIYIPRSTSTQGIHTPGSNVTCNLFEGQLHARQQSAAPRCMRASASTITQIAAKLTRSLQEYFAVTISFFNTVPAGVTCSSRLQLALHSTFFNTASTHRLQYLHAGSV